jgi:hypothetical protein
MTKLRQVIRWGLSRSRQGHVGRDEDRCPVPHLFVMGDPELHQQGHKTARASGVKVAP